MARKPVLEQTGGCSSQKNERVYGTGHLCCIEISIFNKNRAGIMYTYELIAGHEEL